MTESTITIVQMLTSTPETWIIAIPDIDATTNGGTILVMLSTNASNKTILAKKAVTVSTQQAVTIAMRELLLFPSVSFS